MRGVSPLLVIVSLTITALLLLRAEFFSQTSEIHRQLRLLRRLNIVKGSERSQESEEEKETVAEDENDISQWLFLSPEKACKPRHQVAFAKTHKTGSSSLQNILLRHGNKHNLTFALPKNSWMFDFNRPFELKMLSNPPWTSIDLFVFHSVWNYEEVHKVLPSALYVTLLRDPVACFESNYVYMGLQGVFKMDINEFAISKAALGLSRSNLTLPKSGITRIIGKNQELWDLGLDVESMEHPPMVSARIKELDDEFDFVLLAEHFDESLVILARKLCWDLEEVRYLRQNSRKASKVSNITVEAKEALTNWLEADFQLYRHFEQKYQQEVESYGSDQLTADVAKLRQLNKQLMDDCVLEVADNSKLKGDFKTALNNGIVEGYLIDPSKPWCNPFAISEPSFTKKVREKQNAWAEQKKKRGAGKV